jgi:hypothetical protein
MQDITGRASILRHFQLFSWQPPVFIGLVKNLQMPLAGKGLLQSDNTNVGLAKPEKVAELYHLFFWWFSTIPPYLL